MTSPRPGPDGNEHPFDVDTFLSDFLSGLEAEDPTGPDL